MRTPVVYESMSGHTRRVAEGIDGIGRAEGRRVAEAPSLLDVSVWQKLGGSVSGLSLRLHEVPEYRP